jgi:hypothetical protein
MSNNRAFIGLVVAATLVAAACGATPDGEAGGETTTTVVAETTVTTQPEQSATSTTAAPTTTTTAAPTTVSNPPDAGGLAYLLVPGTSVFFEGTMGMAMEAEFTGLEGEPDAPSGPVETAFDAAIIVRFDVEEGVEPDTFRVTQSIEVAELTAFSVTTDGETLDLEDIGDIETYLDGTDDLFGPPMEFIVTADGEVIGGGAGGDAGSALEAFGGNGAGLGSQQLWGPTVPPGDLAVGDTWSATHTEEITPGSEFTTTATSTVVGEDEIDGHAVLVIETVVESTGGSFSFGDLDLSGEELTEEESAFMAFFDIDMTVSPSMTATTAWFDPETRLVRRHEGSSDLGFGMGFGGLPDTTGPVTMEMVMTVDFATQLTSR